MAGGEAPKRRDPHGWNSLENYVFLHEKHVSEHPLVLHGSSFVVRIFQRVDAPYDLITVEGLLVCVNGIHLEFSKWGEVDRTRARRVRMKTYRYNAWFPGGHNVLRCDNMHTGNENAYHRHRFDPATGDEVEYSEMAREDFPVMHEILDELAQMFPPAQP